VFRRKGFRSSASQLHQSRFYSRFFIEKTASHHPTYPLKNQEVAECTPLDHGVLAALGASPGRAVQADPGSIAFGFSTGT